MGMKRTTPPIPPEAHMSMLAKQQGLLLSIAVKREWSKENVLQCRKLPSPRPLAPTLPWAPSTCATPSHPLLLSQLSKEPETFTHTKMPLDQSSMFINCFQPANKHLPSMAMCPGQQPLLGREWWMKLSLCPWGGLSLVRQTCTDLKWSSMKPSGKKMPLLKEGQESLFRLHAYLRTKKWFSHACRVNTSLQKRPSVLFVPCVWRWDLFWVGERRPSSQVAKERSTVQKGLGETRRRIHKQGGKWRDEDIRGNNKWFCIGLGVSTWKILFHKMILRVLSLSYLNEEL